jgi:hypothetical protein
MPHTVLTNKKKVAILTVKIFLGVDPVGTDPIFYMRIVYVTSP